MFHLLVSSVPWFNEQHQQKKQPPKLPSPVFPQSVVLRSTLVLFVCVPFTDLRLLLPVHLEIRSSLIPSNHPYVAQTL